jgi:AICAR transformylase/IMP cyclohydrolase PurH
MLGEIADDLKEKLGIDFCNKNKIAMIFTGKRHFKH